MIKLLATSSNTQSYNKKNKGVRFTNPGGPLRMWMKGCTYSKPKAREGGKEVSLTLWPTLPLIKFGTRFKGG